MRGFSRNLGWRQKKALHLKKCANFHKLQGETTKKGSLLQNLQKKQFLLTNSGVITSILGVSGLELHFSGTKPVTFFGAQSSLGGHNFCFVGRCSDLGRTALECPPWRRAYCKFTVIYWTVTIVFSLKRCCSKSVLLKKWELFKVTKRCPKPFSTISFICENTI